MATFKSKKQQQLYNAIVREIYNLEGGTQFTYNDLVKSVGTFGSTTNEQREVGRRIAAWAKKSNSPFQIVPPGKSPLLYEKI